MAIKVSGTSVINDSRALQNIASVDSTTAAAITAAGVGGGEVVLLTDNGALSNTTYIEVSFTGDYRMYIVQFVNARTNSTGFSAGYTNSSGNLITSTNYYKSSTGGGTAYGSESMFFCGENSRPIDGFHFIHDPYSTSSFSLVNSFITRKQDSFSGRGLQNEDQNQAERHNSIKYWVGANSGPSGVFNGGNYNVWGVTAP
tara:strand:- start:231 stop:830 length:600 start_codon:yes stop_codon:yes gene_type:complete